MASYYQNLSNQRDAFPAPYLRDRKLDPGSETPYPPTDMIYSNQSTSTMSFPEIFSRSSHSFYDPSFGAQDELEFIPTTSERTSVQIIDSEQNLRCQELSLSLGTHLPSEVHLPSFDYQYANQDTSFNTIKFGDLNGSYSAMSPNDKHFSLHLCRQLGGVTTICNSKYLKAAQKLLDEVINVEEAMKQFEKNKQDGSYDVKRMGNSADPHESTINCSPEISRQELQDLQNKLPKLLSILDAVDTRYRQYNNQLQILVSSFEMVSGHGAAKPYTSLVLKTISHHFRILHDAINGHIKLIRGNSGGQDSDQLGLPRLRYVEQKLRKQNQFGVMNHSWRPQRGLPENSVSILRAWLFEHFLHPYPKEMEKITLAKKTGLSRRQVANWFINARVRLWKPMVEEMYKEEFGEVDFKSSPENAPRTAMDRSWPSQDMREELQDFVND